MQHISKEVKAVVKLRVGLIGHKLKQAKCKKYFSKLQGKLYHENIIKLLPEQHKIFCEPTK